MIPAHTFHGQKVGVFGLGKAGEAAVASLLAGGAEVFAWDDKLVTGYQLPVTSDGVTGYQLPVTSDGVAGYQLPVTSDGVAGNQQLATSNYAEWPWAELSALILAPGIAKTHACATLAKQHGVPIMGDVELLYRSQPHARYIGITGTNGKSTTTALIGHILHEAGMACQVGGNLGTAAVALEPLGVEGIYVLELSSYQLELLHTTRFNVAVFLNITPDHLERHGDMAGYVAAKKHIFDRQTADDVAVIAVDDEYTREIVERGTWNVERVMELSAQRKLEYGIYVLDAILHDAFFTNHVPRTTCHDIHIANLTGQHNWQNAAAAYAACRAVGVAPEKIIAAMRSFPGLRHRLQLVATINGVRFINDSKATNADAVQHALKPYRNIFWIAGGKAKAGGIEPLVPLFSHIAHAFLIGEAEDMFAKTLEGKVPYTRCGTLEVAVQKAAEMAFGKMDPRVKREDDDAPVVLLSPACASFDQFKSFEHRGDVFCELVSVIPPKGGIHAMSDA